MNRFIIVLLVVSGIISAWNLYGCGGEVSIGTAEEPAIVATPAERHAIAGLKDASAP